MQLWSKLRIKKFLSYLSASKAEAENCMALELRTIKKAIRKQEKGKNRKRVRPVAWRTSSPQVASETESLVGVEKNMDVEVHQ